MVDIPPEKITQVVKRKLFFNFDSAKNYNSVDLEKINFIISMKFGLDKNFRTPLIVNPSWIVAFISVTSILAHISFAVKFTVSISLLEVKCEYNSRRLVSSV